MAGWIALHRDIQDHWIYEEKRVFSQYEAWTSILMRVNHKEGKVMHNGTLEVVERGSTIWSMGDMEKVWGWSNTKVKRFLKRLESDEMVIVKSTTKKTYLTVVNYDKFQFVAEEKTPPKHQENTTETLLTHTNNNVNNDNNEKQKIPYAEIVEYLNQKAGTNFKHSTTSTKGKITARWNDGFTLEQFKMVIDNKVADWMNTDQQKYLRPETLFGNKFEGYLNQKVSVNDADRRKSEQVKAQMKASEMNFGPDPSYLPTT